MVKGRNGKGPAKMAIAVLEDLMGKTEIVIFPDQFAEVQDLVAPDQLVFVRGSVDRRREVPSVRTSKIFAMEMGPEVLSTDCEIKINSPTLAADTMDKLRAICKKYPGQTKLIFRSARRKGKW